MDIVMGRPELTPVSELNDLEHERLRFSLDLPQYCPSDQIGISVDRLDRLLRLMNVGDMQVSLYGGDITKVEHGITGYTFGGVATASGRKKITPADLESSSVAPVETNLVERPDGEIKRSYADTFQPRRGAIKLNINEVEDRIPNNKLKDSNAWSHVLDQALREGVSKTIMQVYFKNPNDIQVVLGSAFLGVIAVPPVISEMSQHSHRGWGLSAAFLAIYKCIEYVVAHDAGISPKDVDKSIFPVWHLDRCLGATVLNKTQKLIKPIS